MKSGWYIVAAVLLGVVLLAALLIDPKRGHENRIMHMRMDDMRAIYSVYGEMILIADANSQRPPTITLQTLTNELFKRGSSLRNPLAIDANQPCYEFVTNTGDIILRENNNVADNNITIVCTRMGSIMGRRKRQ